MKEAEIKTDKLLSAAASNTSISKTRGVRRISTQQAQLFKSQGLQGSPPDYSLRYRNNNLPSHYTKLNKPQEAKSEEKLAFATSSISSHSTKSNDEFLKILDTRSLATKPAEQCEAPVAEKHPSRYDVNYQERYIKGVNDDLCRKRLLKIKGLYESSDDYLTDSSMESIIVNVSGKLPYKIRRLLKESDNNTSALDAIKPSQSNGALEGLKIIGGNEDINTKQQKNSIELHEVFNDTNMQTGNINCTIEMLPYNGEYLNEARQLHVPNASNVEDRNEENRSIFDDSMSLDSVVSATINEGQTIAAPEQSSNLSLLYQQANPGWTLQGSSSKTQINRTEIDFLFYNS